MARRVWASLPRADYIGLDLQSSAKDAVAWISAGLLGHEGMQQRMEATMQGLVNVRSSPNMDPT